MRTTSQQKLTRKRLNKQQLAAVLSLKACSVELYTSSFDLSVTFYFILAVTGGDGFKKMAAALLMPL